MRLNFDWLDDPAVTSYGTLNEVLFFTKDAAANGFVAASELLAANILFMTEMQPLYRPSFARIRPVSAIRSAGVILHKYLNVSDPALSETECVDSVLELLSFLLFRCNPNTAKYGFLMAGEYFDYLKHRGGPGVDYAADKIIEKFETSSRGKILKKLLEPKVSLSSYGDFCLYGKIFEAIERRGEPAQWFQANMSQAAILKAYQSAGYPVLKSVMTRQTRGHALEADLGL